MNKSNFTTRLGKLTVVSVAAATLAGCVAPMGMQQQNIDQSNTVFTQLSRSAPANALLPIHDRTPGSPANAQYLAGKPLMVAKSASRPWLGARMIEVQSDETLPPRSEERRVGKECRSRWSPYH